MPRDFRYSRSASPNASSGPGGGWICLVRGCANYLSFVTLTTIVPRTIVRIPDLMKPCHCGGQNDEDARYCRSCGSSLGSNPPMASPTDLICPRCESSSNTQRIQVLCLSATDIDTSESYGGFYSSGYSGGDAYRWESTSTTGLAQSLTPGPAPSSAGTTGCALVLAAFGICTTLFIFGDDANNNRIFDFVFGGLLIWGAGWVYNNGKRLAISRYPAWREKQLYYESGWICMRCGMQWRPK